MDPLLRERREKERLEREAQLQERNKEVKKEQLVSQQIGVHSVRTEQRNAAPVVPEILKKKVEDVKRGSSFVGSVRFYPPLPTIPFPAKGVRPDLGLAKFAEYAPTELERDFGKEYVPEPNLGVRISIVDTSKFEKGKGTELPSRDKEVLDGIVVDTSRRPERSMDAMSQPFLRRPMYSEHRHAGAINKELLEAIKVERKKAKDFLHNFKTPKEIFEVNKKRVVETFNEHFKVGQEDPRTSRKRDEAGKKPDENPNPQKKRRIVSIDPLLPDFDTLSHPTFINFDPTPLDNSLFPADKRKTAPEKFDHTGAILFREPEDELFTFAAAEEKKGKEEVKDEKKLYVLRKYNPIVRKPRNYIYIRKSEDGYRYGKIKHELQLRKRTDQSRYDVAVLKIKSESENQSQEASQEVEKKGSEVVENGTVEKKEEVKENEDVDMENSTETAKE